MFAGFAIQLGIEKAGDCVNSPGRRPLLKGAEMPKYNLVGQRFGRLVVLRETTPYRSTTKVHSRWECDCDCGGSKIVRGDQLRAGLTQSCGCLNAEYQAKRAKLIPLRCAFCRSLFEGYAHRRFCSHGCYSQDLKQKALRQFNRYVIRRDGCWGSTRTAENVYWSFTASGTSYTAHRFAYEHFIGPIPEGLFVCHRCDNKHCTNPEHLFAGTPKENSEDASRKLRMEHGEDRWNAKLTEDDIRTIRSTFASGGISKAELARRFSVDPSWITRIVERRVWRHVT
jgi:hypothetical protein